MAYYPDIPQAEDEIRDSQPYILANFQELEGLANEKDNILEVSELAPYKDVIANSRIVEHNLDVSDPSNGYYVRWENGLQVCMSQTLSVDATYQRISGVYRSAGGERAEWNFPAEFIASPFCKTSLADSGIDPSADSSGIEVRISYTKYELGILTIGSSLTDIDVRGLAIGRWK